MRRPATILVGVVVLYYVIGLICYTLVVEQFTALDAFVFLTTILTTIGFGDPWVPTNSVSMLFTSVLVIFAAAFVASSFGVLASKLVHGLESLFGGVMHATLSAAFPRSSVSSSTERERKQQHSIGAVAARSALCILCVVFLGALLFRGIEPTTFPTWVDALYFSAVTCSTVGFGDIAPQSSMGKVAMLLYSWIGVALFANNVGAAAAQHARKEKRQAHLRVIEKLSLANLRSMDTNDDGSISYAEFELWCLRALSKKEDLHQIAAHWQEFDPNNTRTVSLSSLHRATDGATELHTLVSAP
tara:strand:- start:36 stop:938 length:903 start_codon:yes stop_codon:yes gene_type:complete